MTMNAFIKQHSVVGLGRAVRAAVAVGLLFGFATSIVALGSVPSASAADVAATVIARYRERIPRLMADQKVPGLAVALVDGDRARWVEGFGYRDHQGGVPVTADTIFSVQSMSKLFTATAVMQAVAAGRLDLDEPITTYLPEFTVHSAFQSALATPTRTWGSTSPATFSSASRASRSRRSCATRCSVRWAWTTARSIGR